MARGNLARRRRIAVRAAKRREAQGVSEAQDPTTVVAGAQGGNFDLGARDESWDSGAAQKSYDLPADSDAYMWRDSQGDNSAKSSYKLPFVSKVGGKHAVWSAITAIAGILQGARGGVQGISPDDRAKIKSKVEGYYAKARGKYKDDSIKVPWESGSASIEQWAEDLATAEVGKSENDDWYIAVLRWLGDFQEDDEEEGEAGEPMQGNCANCEHDADLHAGPLNDGACSVEGCSCQGFEEIGESEYALAAAAEIAWDSEQGVRDVMEDIAELLNPEGTHRWCVVDLALDASNVLLCDGAEGEYYVAPVSIGPDKEPTLPPTDQWIEVDTAWVKEAGLDREAQFLVMARLFRERLSGAAKPQHFRLEEFTLAEALTADGEIFSGGVAWRASLCPEGKVTDDGRIFAPGSVSWRDLPLSLMGMVETQQGHDGAEVCGRIESVWRDQGGGLPYMIWGRGEFDPGEYGSEIARLVGNQTLRGISVDVAPVKVEVARREDVVDEDGIWIEQAASENDGEEQAEEQEEVEGPSLIDILFGTDEEMVTVVREGVLGAATVCPFPAFADATIEVEKSLVAAQQSPMIWTVTSQAGWVLTPRKAAESAAEGAEGVERALTASAAGLAPLTPPAAWFEDPQLPELTAMVVSDEGRVYGHAAAWDTCHTGIPGVCTTAPVSQTDYAYFHLKEVVCEDGERVAVGTITLDAPHAELDLGRAAATAHYDHTGVAAADVRVGEDEHGIWIAGAIRPDLDELRVRRLRGASLSGDWRAMRLSDGSSSRELIALLAVNVPGFPVPRPAVALVASAAGGVEVTAQIGSGQHAGKETTALVAKRKAEIEAARAAINALGEEAAAL
jgi:hypothetical protein